MNELRSVRRLRPEIEPLDVAIHERILTAIVGTTESRRMLDEPTVPDSDSDLTLEPISGRARAVERSRPVLLVAAAIVSIVGIGALVGIQSVRDGSEMPAPAMQPEIDSDGQAGSDPLSPASVPEDASVGLTTVLQEDASAGVTMVLPELPEGLSLVDVSPPSIRDETSTVVRQLYGAAEDRGDPSRMILLEHDPSGMAAIPCHSFTSFVIPTGVAVLDPVAWRAVAVVVDGSIAFTTPDGPDSTEPTATGAGASCIGPDGLAQAGWFAGDDTSFSLVAGSAVSPQSLIQFAQAVRPATGAGTTSPSVDPLPDGFTPLFTDDVAYTNRVVDTVWIASDSELTDVEREEAAAEAVANGEEIESEGQLRISSWQGAGDAGIYAMAIPIGAERVTVRGQVGYQFIAEPVGGGVPSEIRIWWAERPGLVVSAQSYGLFQPDELVSLINDLQPADAEEFEQFATAYG